MEDNKKFWKGALLGALITLAVIAAGNGLLQIAHVKGVNLFGSIQQSMKTRQKLDQIQDIIDTYYLYEDEVDEEALREGVYAGYVEALGDPYSVYYTKEEKEALLEGIEGTYTGIGAAMLQNAETGEVVVSKVYDDSPAEEAGMKSGDIIYQVDDRMIGSETLEEVVTWIRGEEGTDVALHILREGEELTLTATRRQLEVPTVEAEMKDDQTGYIYVSEFDTVTLGQFEKALKELETQGMQGLIIDLRGNPGGNVVTVTEMLKLLLPKGTILTVKDKNGDVQEYKSDGAHEFTKPLVVLVNQYSASASEIFAGAVKDYGVGKIVGKTTFGKGIVQNVIGLQDGSAMKITMAEYFTPSGKSIHKKGVTPDVEVEYEADPEDPLADNQLERALEVIKEQL